ncbi:glycoside hydrolase family 43 protein [Saccharibacillus sp. CPCC 101409]|uniref:glycoside hydrolase family 43 protein n=1 Tax=Saccharibacillus sp. CPCC 101409 TaxID=3058041 RepID=UPI00267313EA|nr:glycoside hydrolase family 43 protein [Saccharibacillus sp. CPCC 101409]MDO3413349.1 glycoside hydrolase family 43 protein [Saccharibacillus sp. CPCC 101409]
MKYANPVIPGFHPDPSICRVGEDYYLVTSTFEYFPGVPVFHSRDLVHWRRIGHCLTNEVQLPLGEAGSSGGIFAPTLRHHDGWFYMTTTNVSGIGNFYVRARNPAGPWSDPIPVAQGGIDPSLLFDEDGKVYFQSACDGGEGNGIYQCEMEIETGVLLTPSRLIWQGTGGACPEGPHLYKVGALYYLMIAEGGTEYGHMETIARSAQPYGPYEACPHNPILSHRSMDSGIQATGHADLVQAQDGSWWAVLLGIRPAAYPKRHHLGRETFLAPVTWTEDGWPIFGRGGVIDGEMQAPQLPARVWPQPPVRDHFESEELGLEWIFLRNPRPGSRSLRERRGYLALRGDKTTLDDGKAPVFVGRRLSHFRCRTAASLTFEPRADGQEAGLTLFMNEKYHYDLFIARREGRKAVVLRKRVGSMITEQVYDCPAGPVVLEADARPDLFFFRFGPEEGSGQRVDAGSGETHFLSTEMAGGFTGVIIAMYAVGGPCPGESEPALFDWFDYEPLETDARQAAD